MKPFYRTFNHYLQEKWGERVSRISLNMGFPCPNRMGEKTGCSFCGETSFLPYSSNHSLSLDQQLEAGKKRLETRYRSRWFYGYFQANTNTFGPLSEWVNFYRKVLEKDFIQGLIISTRPDWIYSEILEELNRLQSQFFPKEIWIELGLQSVHDQTLTRIHRGHTYLDFQQAVKKIKTQSAFPIGVHMINGLPGETKEMIVQGIHKLFSENPIQAIKFHDLDIIKKTPLEKEYQEHPEDFIRFTEAEYIDFVSTLIENIPKEIILMRIISDHPSHWVLENGAGKSLTKQKILKTLEKTFQKRGSFQGMALLN